MMKWRVVAFNIMLIASIVSFADDDLQQIQQLQQTGQRAKLPVAPVVTARSNGVPTQLPDAPPPPVSESGPMPPPVVRSSDTSPAAQVATTPASLRKEDSIDMRDQAFVGVTESMLPMSPAQIRRLRELFSEIQESSTEIPGVPPRPTSTSMIVNLAPGAVPPVVRLSAGFVTSLVFLDATGAAWPIEAYDIGDPKSFNIQWDKKSNTLLIQAMNFYKQGNLAVMLKDLNTPIMVTLLPGQKAVDYRVDMQVPRMGPNAEPAMNGLPSGANPELLNVLNGMPPAQGKALKVMGGECQAWVTESKLFLRTPLTIISPSWVSMMSGPDGAIHAYELPKASVILALQQGKMIKLTVEGF